MVNDHFSGRDKSARGYWQGDLFSADAQADANVARCSAGLICVKCVTVAENRIERKAAR